MEPVPLVVTETHPDDVVVICERTEIVLLEKPAKSVQSVKATGTTYENVGGLRSEVQRVREMIELPMKHPEVFQKLGIEPPKGVLLYGPPGTGKTLIAKAVANESGANFISIAGPEIMSKYYGESEQRLREIFDDAQKAAPSIIFIDEIDSIAPRRGEVTGEVERRVVAQLLAMMDGLKERGQVVVIGATNREEAIDPALRRPGRFDREIEIGVPDRAGRIEILQIHMRNMPIAEDVNLESLADRMHGFVGADVNALCKEAAMKALRRYLPDLTTEDEIPQEIVEKMQVMGEDFEEALKEIEPSAMREVLVEVPRVQLERSGWSRGTEAGTDRGHRVAYQAAGEVPQDGHTPAQGNSALRSAGHGKDHDRPGGGQRDQCQLHQHPGAADALQVGGRVGKSHTGDLPQGKAGLSCHHILR